MEDPNPSVRGKGLRCLHDLKMELSFGVEEEEAKKITITSYLAQRSQKRQSTPNPKKRNSQERNPSDILHQRIDKTPRPKPILQQRKSQIPRSGKHDSARQPDLKRVFVESVDWQWEAEDEVVDDGERHGGGEAVVTFDRRFQIEAVPERRVESLPEPTETKHWQIYTF